MLEPVFDLHMDHRILPLGRVHPFARFGEPWSIIPESLVQEGLEIRERLVDVGWEI